MTLEERSRLSYYRELTPLNAEHGVFLVQHVETGELFVRKVLVNYQPDIFARLKDFPVPNMPQILEAIEDNGRLILIETYLSGKTLQKRLDEQGPFPLPQACRIGIELCRILVPLHRQGIIHRDIKPSNIILSEDGVVKLLDLDAAKLYQPEEPQDTRLIGTQGYAAPEQYGFGASSPATDIFAIGVLLHVLATGAFPKPQIRTSDPGLNAVIARCTRLEPAARYRTVWELSAALQDVLKAKAAAQPVVYTAPQPVVSAAPQPVVYNAPAPERVSAPAPPAYVPYSQPASPSYAPQPFAAGAEAAEQRSGMSRLTPPGFRSGRIWKMIPAIAWYALTVLLFISFITDTERTESLPDRIGLAGFSVILMLGVPFFLCNYLGIWQKLHIDRVRSVFLRYVLALLCVVFGAFAWAALISLILVIWPG